MYLLVPTKLLHHQGAVKQEKDNINKWNDRAFSQVVKGPF